MVAQLCLLALSRAETPKSKHRKYLTAKVIVAPEGGNLNSVSM